MVLDSRVGSTPHADLYSYIDYWGSVVHAFDLHEPHDELTVIGQSMVETLPSVPPGGHLTWEELEDRRLRDRYAEAARPRPGTSPLIPVCLPLQAT